MGMSTRITGLQPPDDEWKAKLAAYNACQAADIPVPDELAAFFDYASPDSSREIDITQAVTSWKDDMKDGFEVEIAKLPPNIKIVRFYNSW